MKNKWLLAALLAGNSWFGGGATDVDPVIMRVNNKDTVSYTHLRAHET